MFSNLVGALAEIGKPTLLIGPSGCGKSHIIKERLLNNSSDVAEIQTLFIGSNEFITSTTLWQRIDEYLEWKHTTTYVPKGNQRLICLIDDINHSHVSISSVSSVHEIFAKTTLHVKIRYIYRIGINDLFTKNRSRSFHDRRTRADFVTIAKLIY